MEGCEVGEVGGGGLGEPPESGTPLAAAGGSGEKPTRRVMKTPYQLEVLERTYAEDQYPSESVRATLSEQLNLSDRQLQMWFCHRRLKDRKPQVSAKRLRHEEEPFVPMMLPPPVLPSPNDLMSGLGPITSMYSAIGAPADGRRHAASSAIPRIGPDVGRRYYEPPMMLPMPPSIEPPMQLTPEEVRVITSVESQLGEPLRDDGPLLGVEFDPLPPGAFGAPIVPENQNLAVRSYDSKSFARNEPKLLKASAFLPTVEHSFIPSSMNGKRKPTDAYEKGPLSIYDDSNVEATTSKIPTLSPGSQNLYGSEHSAAYAFHGQLPSAGTLGHQGLPQVFPSLDTGVSCSSYADATDDYGSCQIAGIENSYLSTSRVMSDDGIFSHPDKKRKSDEAKIAKEVEAHEKRIRKEIEKQDVMRRKREEQMRKEMERHDRERRKEEERLIRERIREEERFQREQRRELERREKFLAKQSRRAEKLRQKEEIRREREAARRRAASERATARRIAKEYIELVEDERLELMELAAQSKGLPSMLYLDAETLQQLNSFRGMLGQFPPNSVQLKHPFSILPWTKSDENVGNLLMVWKFLFTFADVLGLWSFTLDEFLQSLHDTDSRLLGEIHVALLRCVIKDIEDAARTTAIGMGANQSGAANSGGGHLNIVEGAYIWGFNIHSWKHHLNFLTWPEIFRQVALAAGFGPQLKKRTVQSVYYRDENEGLDGENVISILRDGSAVERAVLKMKQRGYTDRRRRHRLTPGTVKYAAFHVLSLEGDDGLSILEVADKIQRSGLRDLTTSKTPEASIAAALSRDSKLFERTAPSTYCVKSPYRKNPADAEALLAAARERIKAFKNDLSDSDGEKDADDADDGERDDDESECDDVDDEIDADDPNITVKLDMDSLVDNVAQEARLPTVIESRKSEVTLGVSSKDVSVKSENALIARSDKTNMASTSVCVDTSNTHETTILTIADTDGTEIDESNLGQSWVQGLGEGDYSDLCVDERLNALAALVGIALEGNSIRVILEERLEAANALKKQMWAEAQLDRRRWKEEYSIKVQYNPYNGFKSELAQETPLETVMNPIHNLEKIGDDGNLGSGANVVHQQGQPVANMSFERNGGYQENIANSDSLQAQQYAHLEKSRSQLKSYIGHMAGQLYIYRSLPLGQDRRRNRYWQFSSSASPNDPGSGRIFFESRDGCWRLIDSVEAFDALLSSLDVRGSREEHLHFMLQRVEPTFKEALKRKASQLMDTGDDYMRNSAVDMLSSPQCSKQVDSPSSTLCGLSSDNMSYSGSFNIELGQTDAEKANIRRRAEVFLNWMVKRCCNSELVCAMKYGEKRCPEVLQFCHNCYSCYLAEEMHCASCHKTFEDSINNEAVFLDHSMNCEVQQKVDPYWKMQVSDYSVDIRPVLLKVQLATIEASIPAEALQPFWSGTFRKNWSIKLQSSSCMQELFQVMTVLECAIKRDYLSPNFETTIELLGSSSPDSAFQETADFLGSVDVLPWVPETAAAVALRLSELDSSIWYTAQRKMEFTKEIEGELLKFPSRYSAVQSAMEIDPLESLDFPKEGRWLDSGSGRRGRGRGGRGSRGGRSRGRGGRPPRGMSRTRTVLFRDDEAAGSLERAPRKYTRRGGRSRGRGGSRRGRRTVRPRPSGSSGSRSISKENLLGSFSLLARPEPASVKDSPGSSGGEDWGLETRRPYVDAEENSTGSLADRFYDNSQLTMGGVYDDQTAGYDEEFTGTSPQNMMDDDEEYVEDEEAGEDEMDHRLDHDAEIEMEDDDDDEMGDDAVGNGADNDDEDGGAASYSSEYSD